LPHEVSGRLEYWLKWSYGGEAVQPLVKAILTEVSGYVDVEKARWQRQFMVENGTSVEVPIELRRENGCYAELVRVRTHGDEWWSFAFETSGEPEQARVTLVEVVNHFLTEHRPCHAFTALNSASYPTWLAAVNR
jgi:hypothetical protein